jgi:hypothetical protein
VGRRAKHCFNQITQLLESLDAVRITLTEGPGSYRSAVWRLHGSNIHLTVACKDDGVTTVQTNDRAPMAGLTFLTKTLAAIDKLATPPHG